MIKEKLIKISFDEYQKIPRMNASTLVHGKTKSMKALRRAMNGRTEPPSKAMRFGNKYHELILEPETFETRFCVMPNFSVMPGNCTDKGAPSTSWATKFCLSSKSKFETDAAADGMQVITREEYDRGLAMCESVADNEYASEIIASCEKEITLLGEIDGVAIKCRLDLCGDVIADLKGTRNASLVPFGVSAAQLAYGFKLSMYREIFRQNFETVPEVLVIAVETDGDFDCVVYDSWETSLDAGYRSVRDVIAQYKQCLKNDRWPGVDRGERSVPVYVPNWSMDEFDLPLQGFGDE